MKNESSEQLLCGLLLLAFDKKALRLAVFPSPREAEYGKKVSVRPATLRGQSVLVFEYAMPDGKMLQKNDRREAAAERIASLIGQFAQADPYTSAGEASYRCSKRGKTVVLGGDALYRRLQSPLDFAAVEAAVASVDNKKHYILRGDEPFLRALGITDQTGRIHDKKQAKFRQINRFLEHVADVYSALPASGSLLVYDLCCGKSYLSFALYAYLHGIRGREVEMLCMDLKPDVIDYCRGVAADCGFEGMHFVCGDVRRVDRSRSPDLLVSLHACDIATDIVLDTGIACRARVILSTPCCHHYLNTRLNAPALSFVSRHGHLRGKLCEALTDALRVLRLEAAGYRVTVSELTDPENTPKNTLIRAVSQPGFAPASPEAKKKKAAYESALHFVLGDDISHYLEETVL